MQNETKKSTHLSKLAWILIVLGFVLTAAFFMYVTRQ